MKREQTREKIVNAFWEIYKTKSIDKIAVKDITEKSGIYRTTFYRYYPDIYAILEELQDKLISDIQSIDMNGSAAKIRTSYHAIAKEQFEKIIVLRKDPFNRSFIKKYEESLIKIMAILYHLKCSDTRIETIVHHTLISMCESFFSWLETGVITFDEAVSILDHYMEFGVVPTINRNLI